MILPGQRAFIEQHSTGIIQYAADKLQRAVLLGLSRAAPELDMSVVNLPFVGSFPQEFRRAWFPSAEPTLLAAGVSAKGYGFLNLRFARIPSRFFSAVGGLLKLKRPPHVIVIYSADNQFLAAAIVYALFARAQICLIIPDLPEFVSDASTLRRIVLRWQNFVFRSLIRRVQYFVLLTDAMKDRLGIRPSRYVVVEGMLLDAPVSLALKWPSSKDRVFAYTGSLMRRYGILDLLYAFSNLPHENVMLLICGEGDARQEVEEAARRDHRIKFYGQVSPERAAELQARAHILVNPRRPVGEYTKYSFPSKTIEYMASGRPVLMHQLPGLPAEYLRHLFIPPTPDRDGLGRSMRMLADADMALLQSVAQRAQAFVTQNKTPEAQCKQIVDLIAPAFRG